jgi:hypothetical protein
VDEGAARRLIRRRFFLSSVQGRDLRHGGRGRRNPTEGELAPNGAIEIAALGGGAQQSFVHGARNALVLIHGPAAEFQLQDVPGFIVTHGGEGGGKYGGQTQVRFLPG